MVPVQMRQQHASRRTRVPSRRSVMRRMPVPASSASTHGPVVVRERDTRRVPADANELRDPAPASNRGRRRREASRRAGRGLVGFLVPVSLADLLERGTVELIAAGDRDPALRDRAQRRRAHCRLRAPPARRGWRRARTRRAASPSTSIASTPSSTRNTSSPGWPCSVSSASGFSFRKVGGSPPRMISPASSRSSAVSTAVTSAVLLVEPHGVLRPNDLRYHCLKSASPTFAASLPAWSYTQCRGKRARAGQLVVARTVGVDRELERGPHQRRPELHEGRSRDVPRRRQRGAAAVGLHERHRLARSSPGRRAVAGARPPRRSRPCRSSVDRRRAHHPATGRSRRRRCGRSRPRPIRRAGSRTGTRRVSRSASRSSITSGGGSS